jgi:hypothetical protein
MGFTISQPTSNSTPDAGQGGGAVTGNTNTGHSTTTCTGNNGASQTKSCVWTTFSPSSVSGTITLMQLKFSWSQSASLSLGNSQFRVQYSIDGGSNWNNVFDHQGFESGSGSETVILSNSQNISQVRVRDRIIAESITDDTTIVQATISSIQLEVTTGQGLAVIAGGC